MHPNTCTYISRLSLPRIPLVLSILWIQFSQSKVIVYIFACLTQKLQTNLQIEHMFQKEHGRASIWNTHSYINSWTLQSLKQKLMHKIKVNIYAAAESMYTFKIWYQSYVKIWTKITTYLLFPPFIFVTRNEIDCTYHTGFMSNSRSY